MIYWTAWAIAVIGSRRSDAHHILENGGQSHIYTTKDAAEAARKELPHPSWCEVVPVEITYRPASGWLPAE